MPVYDYKCSDHGIFYQLATMAESAKPANCPTCNKLSARIICLSPSALSMDEDKKHAHEVNEKSSCEPEFSNNARRAEDEQHSKGCGCKKSRGSSVLYTAEGNKIFPSMRPWMISH